MGTSSLPLLNSTSLRDIDAHSASGFLMFFRQSADYDWDTMGRGWRRAVTWGPSMVRGLQLTVSSLGRGHRCDSRLTKAAGIALRPLTGG